MPDVTRRQVLQGLAVGALGAAVAGDLVRPAVAAAEVPRPTGPGTVRYEDLYRPGSTLQQVIQAVPGGSILTFPEGEFTFRDFASPVGWYDGIRITPNCRGLAGSGPNTVFSMVPGSSTKAGAVPAQAQGGTNPCYLMRIDGVTDAVLQNFSLIGTPQGHFYGGLKVAGGSGAVLDGLYLRGANPGDHNTPPGETFGIALWKTAGPVLRTTEIDGRDASGARVSASPVAGLSSSDVTLQNVYAHHSRTASPTFYDCVNLTTVDLRSEYNGTGPGGLNAAGINHENVRGRVRHTRPRLIIDRAGGNTGLHVHIQNGLEDGSDIVLTDVVHDAGPSSGGCFSVLIGDTYRDPEGRPQQQRTLPTVTREGVTLKPVDGNTSTGGATAAQHYIRYH